MTLMFFRCVVTGTFSNTMKFIVKDCDPNTGEADEEGYNDEYVVCIRTFYEISGSNDVKPGSHMPEVCLRRMSAVALRQM